MFPVDSFEMNVGVGAGVGVLLPSPTDAKTLERMSERSYVRDWTRLGLTSSSSSGKSKDPFKITTVNSVYMMCRR